MTHRTRQLLTGIPAVNTAVGESPKLLCWSVPLFGIATYLGLLAGGTLRNAGRANAPLWVIGVIGAVFGLAGLLVLVRGISALARRRRAALQSALRPGEPWFADYPWNPHGIADNRPGKLRQALVGLLFVGLFLVPFHWVFWNGARQSWIFGLVLVGIDFGALIGVAFTIRLALQSLRYPRGRLSFHQFPYFVGESLQADFSAPPQIARFRSMTFELRKVEQVLEERQYRQKTEIRQVSYQCYQDSYTLQAGVDLPSGQRKIPLIFRLPSDVPGTAIRENPGRFWQLDIRADVPGIDYHATFLVPVYQRSAANSNPSSATPNPVASVGDLLEAS